MADGAFDYLGAADPMASAKGKWRVGDRVYSKLHDVDGEIVRIDAKGIWVRGKDEPRDHCTLHQSEHLKRSIVTAGAQGRAANLAFAMVPLHRIKPILKSRYLVKGWLDRGAFSIVYGESNVGKTFFALDLAMHVAAAQEWHGHKVPGNDDYAGPVVYIAGEGGAGLSNRIEALRRERPHLMKYTEENGDFVLLPVMIDLCGSDDAAAIVEALDGLDMPPALIVIDTLAMAFGGGDENTARDMGIFVNNCRNIRAETGAHVMVIHHSGKDTSKGARGSGALRAASDTEIELTTDGKVIIAETRKQRDMEGGAVFAYSLRGVFLGMDEDGDKVTSAVIEPTEAPAKRAPRLKGQALIAMQAFADALKDHGVAKTGEDFPHNRKCVSLEHWREACDRHSLSAGEGESSKRTAFHKQKTALHERGLIRIFDGFAWRCDE